MLTTLAIIVLGMSVVSLGVAVFYLSRACRRMSESILLISDVVGRLGHEKELS